MSSSSDWHTICLILLFLQNSSASLNSLTGKEQEEAVTAITLSVPNVSTAAFSRKVESTPLENATAHFQAPISNLLISDTSHKLSSCLSSLIFQLRKPDYLRLLLQVLSYLFFHPDHMIPFSKFVSTIMESSNHLIAHFFMKMYTAHI